MERTLFGKGSYQVMNFKYSKICFCSVYTSLCWFRKTYSTYKQYFLSIIGKFWAPFKIFNVFIRNAAVLVGFFFLSFFYQIPGFFFFFFPFNGKGHYLQLSLYFSGTTCSSHSLTFATITERTVLKYQISLSTLSQVLLLFIYKSECLSTNWK